MPNAIECVEDETIFDLDGRTFDENETLCPLDIDHWVRPILVSPKGVVPDGVPEHKGIIPDGVPEHVAEDFYHHGREQYEFVLVP